MIIRTMKEDSLAYIFQLNKIFLGLGLQHELSTKKSHSEEKWFRTTISHNLQKDFITTSQHCREAVMTVVFFGPKSDTDTAVLDLKLSFSREVHGV